MTAPAAPEALACSNRSQGDVFEASGRVHAQQAVQLHLKTVQARVQRAQEALTSFEEQWQHVVQQIFALQQVAQLLRQEDYIDHARVDAVLRHMRVVIADMLQNPDDLLNDNANQSAGAQTGPEATNQAVVGLVGGPNMHGKRRRNLRRPQLDVLRRWFDEHAIDPYPSPEEKAILSLETQMEVQQVEQCVRTRHQLHSSTTCCWYVI